MQIHLYWIDKSRRKKGVGLNHNLIIDYENKTYKVYVDPYYGYNRKDDIEITKKSDIYHYIDMLQDRGFTEKKSDF